MIDNCAHIYLQPVTLFCIKEKNGCSLSVEEGNYLTHKPEPD